MLSQLLWKHFKASNGLAAGCCIRFFVRIGKEFVAVGPAGSEAERTAAVSLFAQPNSSTDH